MMSDVVVVENYVDAQCVRHLHLMSNAHFTLTPCPSPSGRGEIRQEAGVWHYRAEFPYRGVLDIACVDGGQNFRRLVIWSLAGCESVRDAISQAHNYFWSLFRFRPGYVFMRKIPAAVEYGQEIEGMVLLEANWMLAKSVAVGGKQ